MFSKNHLHVTNWWCGCAIRDTSQPLPHMQYLSTPPPHAIPLSPAPTCNTSQPLPHMQYLSAPPHMQYLSAPPPHAIPLSPSPTCNTSQPLPTCNTSQPRPRMQYLSAPPPHPIPLSPSPTCNTSQSPYTNTFVAFWEIQCKIYKTIALGSTILQVSNKLQPC